MLPQPLHPAVVHFPIVFVVLLPIVALIAIAVIWRGAPARRSWTPVVGVAAALLATSWLAVETGEREEDAVEQVVAESAIHDHEERAELFLPLTLVGLIVVAAGLLKGRPGQVMRGASVVLTLGMMYAGYQVGHSGGELVYGRGAASAYFVDSGSAGDDHETPDPREKEREEHRP